MAADTIIQTPGKFEGETEQTAELWEESLDSSFLDDEIGSVQELGWYGMRRDARCILSESSQGFVHGEYFDSEAELNAAWSEIEAEYEAFYAEQDAAESHDELATETEDFPELSPGL